jgi:hypothetical protein
MIERLTALDKITLASISAGFLGTFLAFIVNTVFKVLIKKECLDKQMIKDALLSGIALSLLVGCATFGGYSFNVQFVEISPIKSTFITTFLILFFSQTCDVLLEICKLSLSKVLNSSNID